MNCLKERAQKSSMRSSICRRSVLSSGRSVCRTRYGRRCPDTCLRIFICLRRKAGLQVSGFWCMFEVEYVFPFWSWVLLLWNEVFSLCSSIFLPTFELNKYFHLEIENSYFELKYSHLTLSFSIGSLILLFEVKYYYFEIKYSRLKLSIPILKLNIPIWTWVFSFWS